MMPSEQELRDLLPWYVNGTLHDATRHMIDLLLERSPLVRGELLWLLQLRSQIQQFREEAEAIADSRPSAFELIAGRQRQGQVALCMEALPDEQRECIHMVFYEDAPLAEIAAVQACPENTVKTRLFHARRKMRECLERQVWRMEHA